MSKVRNNMKISSSSENGVSDGGEEMLLCEGEADANIADSKAALRSSRSLKPA